MDICNKCVGRHPDTCRQCPVREMEKAVTEGKVRVFQLKGKSDAVFGWVDMLVKTCPYPVLTEKLANQLVVYHRN